jgi:hypothetical protein
MSTLPRSADVSGGTERNHHVSVAVQTGFLQPKMRVPPARLGQELRSAMIVGRAEGRLAGHEA